MARRSKFYAAETGTAYRYFFSGSRRVTRPMGQGSGYDYAFVVTADQGFPFVLRIFIADRALAAWREAEGRDLHSNEIYAVSKMRLFHAFDEVEALRRHAVDILVDETNIRELLSPLNL
jgi:hypothetical protein